jgi:succinate dehydrogenase / fumarate reductase membrane anchor subunit
VSGPAKFRNNVKISERHGASEWATEKLALLLLMPLGVWLASTAFTLAGAGRDGALVWFADKVNAGLLAVTAIVFFGFASLAWKVVVEDYVHKPGSKAFCIGLINIVCIVLAAASVFFIVRLALGSAPLPAGV